MFSYLFLVFLLLLLLVFGKFINHINTQLTAYKWHTDFVVFHDLIGQHLTLLVATRKIRFSFENKNPKHTHIRIRKLDVRVHDDICFCVRVCVCMYCCLICFHTIQFWFAIFFFASPVIYLCMINLDETFQLKYFVGFCINQHCMGNINKIERY